MCTQTIQRRRDMETIQVFSAQAPKTTKDSPQQQSHIVTEITKWKIKQAKQTKQKQVKKNTFHSVYAIADNNRKLNHLILAGFDAKRRTVHLPLSSKYTRRHIHGTIDLYATRNRPKHNYIMADGPRIQSAKVIQSWF